MPDRNKPYRVEVTRELIVRYNRGELDAKTRHALERQALDDPFLYEALEGYALRGADQSKHLDEISQRLQALTKPKKRGPVQLPWIRYRNAQIAAAAVLLLLIGAGIFFFTPVPHKPTEQLAINKKNAALPDSGRSGYSLPEASAADTVSGPAVALNTPRQPPATSLSENKSRPAEREKKAQAAPSLRRDTLDIAATGGKEDRKTAAIASAESTATGAEKKIMMARVAPAVRKQSGADTVFITGKVRDAVTEEPLTGVTVSVAGEQQGTTSDTSGSFQLRIPAGPQTLRFAYLGYNNAHVTAGAANRNLLVSLHPDNRALKETVVVGYSIASQNRIMTRARPVSGFAAFRRYVKDSLHYPAEALKRQIEGTVKISFLVLPDSSLQQVRIMEDPGYGCGSEALRLLKEGPSWYPVAPGDTGRAEVKIRFDLNKARQ